ncbi:MAG TPA: hypothetical protein VF739_11740, partial [Ktedonobacterales bacterium]
MTNAGPVRGNTGKVGAAPAQKRWTTPRNYRWTELWLLLFPSLFMLLGLVTLLIVNGQHIDLRAKELPPLLAFTPVIGLLIALLGAHVALIFVAPDADE